jgi:hypothetical protein
MPSIVRGTNVVKIFGNRGAADRTLQGGDRSFRLRVLQGSAVQSWARERLKNVLKHQNLNKILRLTEFPGENNRTTEANEP